MTDVSVTISEEPVAVSIGSGTGPAGAAGSSGVITVSAPLTNSGTSSAAILGLSVGSGLSIVSGALTAVAGGYTLPVASASVLGGVKQGSNVTIDGTGILSVAAPVTWSTISGRPTFATVATSGAYADLSGTPAAYSLPTATSGVLGGIKIGSGLSIDGSGVVTAAGTYTLPAATTSTLGGVIVGTGLAVTSGTVSVSYGTSSSTACVGNDARLSDARTPTAHTQAWSTITATPTTLTGYGITDAAASTHTHGNLTNAGAIGSTSGQIVVTTASGVLTTAATISASAVSGLAAVATSGSGSDITTGTLAAARLGTHASTHQTGGADAVASVVVSPTSLAADVNDWAIGTGDVFRVAGTAARNVTGIAAVTSGLAILLVNVGSFSLTLKHQSSSSTAANRFTIPWAGDCILAASGGAVVLVYDSTSSTWRVV